MSKAAHNIPPKRLSVEIRKTIALDAVANTISSAARQHQVTNKTAARHRNKALEAINQTFDVTIQQILTAVHKFKQFSIKQHDQSIHCFNSMLSTGHQI